ncbi:hypothetical protein [Sulfurimonas autotrophica]|uniref:Lipoprotein n=1 Tax=Sulfurimonas autotrophica (strain ATCC BAA-671 / DSM 16294 / JCM 11897 / OK10) TaxID=563040 RepID=E0UR71_SULAO|nr:hypothetical protein [Sulfurimonas autotrophica]ADN08881.1 conserved hypothetical protein [Sulfurimonas autotrophica DSM 16294]
MKKIIISTISIVLSGVIFNACSTTSMNAEDTKTASFTHLEHEMPLGKVHKLILKAGEENGWRMTEFKENELIAEKEENGSMKAVTITFTQHYFGISPKDSDLHEAIEKELNN